MIRRPLFLLLSLAVVVAIVAGLAYRPATIAGVHANELAKSVDDAAGGKSGVCRELDNGDWICTSDVEHGNKRQPIRYRVRVHGHFGCWKGGPVGSSGGHISGCITVLDYL